MQEQPAVKLTSIESASEPFVVRWADLVSTTNWDKGRIITQWRDALVAAGRPKSECSDEAWARLVGAVSSQHVGRLRRVYARFGDVQRDYAGLYWSHFQVALEWNDAEMWLEGAVQSGWSVSQMRTARWEALGAPAELKPRDEDVLVADLDEDVDPTLDFSGSEPPPLTTTTEEVRQTDASDSRSSEESDADERALSAASKTAPVEAADESDTATAIRPFQRLPQLPDDLAEAVEMFKLAILHHKLSDWSEVSRQDVLASLEALRQLALAPSEA